LPLVSFRTNVAHCCFLFRGAIWHQDFIVHGPDISSLYSTRNLWILFYFVPRTSPTMNNGCHHHQIGIDYLCDVIFIILYFHYNSFSIIDRDEILVSSSMFLRMSNPMMIPKNRFDSWLTRNSKQLSLEPVET